MKRILPVLILLVGFAATSWAQTEPDLPGDTGESAPMQSAVATDANSAASPRVDGRRLGQRIRIRVLEAIAESIEEDSDISDADKTAIAAALQKAATAQDWSRLGEGISNSRVWLGAISILSILLIFGTPIMLVAAFLYAGQRKRRLAHDMASQYLASGQSVPPEVWQGLSGDASPRSNLHKGMMMLGVGAGVFLAFWLMGSTKAAYLALIPLFIGIAQLLIWKLEKNKESPK